MCVHVVVVVVGEHQCAVHPPISVDATATYTFRNESDRRTLPFQFTTGVSEFEGENRRDTHTHGAARTVVYEQRSGTRIGGAKVEEVGEKKIKKKKPPDIEGKTRGWRDWNVYSRALLRTFTLL